MITRVIECTECTACVRHIKPSERLIRTITNAFVLPLRIFILLVFGVILGLVDFVLLLAGFICISLLYSPLLCVIQIAYRKLLNAYMSGGQSSLKYFKEKMS